MSEPPESSPNLPSAIDTLSERQRAAISLLILGMTHTAVAAELGLNRRTLWEWKQDRAFMAALDAELDEIRADARLRMFALTKTALATLEHVLEHGYTGGEKMAAVRVVLKCLEPVAPDKSAARVPISSEPE